jgi:hypothetical protein
VAAMDGPPAFPHPDSMGDDTTPPAQPATFDDATAPFPDPVAGEPPISVVLHEEPKNRRTGLFVGAGVVAVAALGMGAFLLLRGGDEKQTYSLKTATAAAAEQKASAYTLSVESMGEELSMDAEVDNTTGLGHMTMQIGGLGDGEIEVIVDTPNEVLYVSSALFESIGLDVKTDWIKMDKEFLADSGDSTMFDAATTDSTFGAAQLLEGAKSVEDLGFEERDLEKLKHYKVTVDAATAIEASPQLEEQVTSIDGELPDEIVYDMYVTKDNQLRRIFIDLDVGTSVIKLDMVVRTLTEPLVIELPDEADFTDASELM